MLGYLCKDGCSLGKSNIIECTPAPTPHGRSGGTYKGSRVGIELQLVFDLLGIDWAVAQGAQLTVAGASPQMLRVFAR
jgi:hypothetical protein